LLVAVLGCGEQSSQAPVVATSAQAQAPKPLPLPPDAPPSAHVLHAYLETGDRLAADDFKGAKNGYGSLARASQAALDGLGGKLSPIAQAGEKASDIAEQRRHFDAASEAVIAHVQSHGNALAEPLSLARCPMAFDNRGARWLQRGETLRNPYYGASMLRCGSVVTKLPAGAAQTKSK
jgi:Cu(I)/Ag(I) efflux system membrane fusion protein